MEESLIRRFAFPAAVALVTGCGLYLRMVRVLPEDFPLNDGGLFYRMTAELQASGYRLPVTTAYNHAGIPFAYPPAGFYLLGWTAALTGAGLLDLLRVVPALLSVLTIPAFAALTRAICRSRLTTIAATVAFVLLIRSWLWLVMGGGLTRSLGFLSALLFLQQLVLMYRERRPLRLAGAVLFGALTVLSHPGSAWFAAYSALLVFLAYGRSAAGVRDTLGVAAGVALVTAPWWLTVVGRHGWMPLLSAAQSGGHEQHSLEALRYFQFTDEPFVGVLGTLGLIGLLVSAAQGRFLLPAWLLAVALLNPRSINQSASVPMAMLVSVAVEAVLLPGIRAATGGRSWLRLDPAPLVLGGLAAYAFMAALSGARNRTELEALSRPNRTAMTWASARTARDSRFLVVTERRSGANPVSEWFPALTGRVSVATPQGYEWLPERQFDQRVARHDSLTACVRRDAACVEAWADRTGTAYDYLYLADPPPSPLHASLRRSSRYAAVYDADGVAIFVRR